MPANPPLASGEDALLRATFHVHRLAGLQAVAEVRRPDRIDVPWRTRRKKAWHRARPCRLDFPSIVKLFNYEITRFLRETVLKFALLIHTIIRADELPKSACRQPVVRIFHLASSSLTASGAIYRVRVKATWGPRHRFQVTATGDNGGMFFVSLGRVRAPTTDMMDDRCPQLHSQVAI